LGLYREWKEIEFPKKYYIWIFKQWSWVVVQEIDGSEVREDGKLVGSKGWKEGVYNREEWKKLLRTARNHCILNMPVEWMNNWIYTTTHGIHFSFETVIIHSYCMCNYRCLWFDHLILCAFWWCCVSKTKCHRTCVI